MRVRSSPLVNDVAFRSAVAGALGLATSVVAYAWIRAVETLIFPQADPRAVVAVTQSGYLVRCAAALFAGGMGAFGGWALAKNPARSGRALIAAAALAIAALAAQSWAVP